MLFVFDLCYISFYCPKESEELSTKKLFTRPDKSSCTTLPVNSAAQYALQYPPTLNSGCNNSKLKVYTTAQHASTSQPDTDQTNLSSAAARLLCTNRKGNEVGTHMDIIMYEENTMYNQIKPSHSSFLIYFSFSCFALLDASFFSLASSYIIKEKEPDHQPINQREISNMFVHQYIEELLSSGLFL